MTQNVKDKPPEENKKEKEKNALLGWGYDRLVVMIYIYTPQLNNKIIVSINWPLQTR